ncbi:Clp protease N-terminal domain-containing protein [Streptomyces sp. NPDC029080]|uniref:Clp protease N-terminal domain-containing protein n=1 Tax=Streptomyces sp. NPDC029080 TaxID=3155017 RepID=UPI0033EB73F4
MTAHAAAASHQDDAAGLGAGLASVVAGARRRAVRDGDRQTDTAHLLHALLEHDPEVRAAMGEPRRLARLLGYLVQRSIGYGLRWQGRVEDSGAVPLVADPDPDPAAAPDPDPAAAPAVGPAAAPAVGPGVGPAVGGGGGDRDAGGWSPAASAALADARARARERGACGVSGTDLLAALVADPRSRAAEVLQRAGVPARELTARIESRGGGPAADEEAAR